MEDQPLIDLQGVSFSAQNKQVVGNVSFQIQKGETFALVGPSGGGKSTVLKLAAGLIVPTSGVVSFRGQDISKMNRHQNLAFRRETAFVFQDSALWANQSLRQTLELPLKIHYPKMSESRRMVQIAKVLAEVGYRKHLDIRPAQLSMGEQKLVAFARAMILEPDIFFLDEWTESLDEVGARNLINIVKRKQQEGKTIVFVSHDFELIRELAGRMCMIMDGRLSLNVSGEEFIANDTLARMIKRGIAL